ncbi:MAG: hypothetical protein AAB647_01115 [Patescibacteria group bacterium]|mgnify:CR=1 FL=1
MKNIPLVILAWIGILGYWGYRFLESNWEKIIALMSIPVTNPVKVTSDWTAWPFVWARGWDLVIFLAIALLIVGLREWLEECRDSTGRPVPLPLNIFGGPIAGLVIGFLWGVIQNPKEPIGLMLAIAAAFGIALLVVAAATQYRYSPWSGIAYVPGVGLGYGIVHGLVAGLVVMGLLLAIVAVVSGPCLAAAGIYLRRSRRPAAAAPPP